MVDDNVRITGTIFLEVDRNINCIICRIVDAETGALSEVIESDCFVVRWSIEGRHSSLISWGFLIAMSSSRFGWNSESGTYYTKANSCYSWTCYIWTYNLLDRTQKCVIKQFNETGWLETKNRDDQIID